jgi:hypothetical protein
MAMTWAGRRARVATAAARAAATLMAAVTTVAVAAACQPPAAPVDPGEVPASVVRREVAATIPAPDGYRLLTVEFADARHGYAAVLTDEPVNAATAADPTQFRYASAIFATSDGGESWRQLADPREPGPSPQMYTVDAMTVVLLDEPVGWHVSTDGGASFRFSPGLADPPELDRLYHPGRVRLECNDGCAVVVDGSVVPTPLAGVVSAAAGGAGRFWAGAVLAGEASTVVSDDEGRTWTDVPVPEHPAGPVERVRLSIAPDGSDVWLVGYPPLAAGGVGQRAPVRRKDVGVPQLWRWDGQAWQVRGTVGAPAARQHPYSVAAIGGGLVAAVGPGGLWLVNEAWHGTELFPVPEWVTTLADGTIFATGPTSGVYYLGKREGRLVSWVRLNLAV